MPRHHYVPQFYLKRFGTERYVSAILMDHGFRFIERASIRGQSYRSDYYKSQFVEDLFRRIEGEAAGLMRTISRYAPLTEDEADFLKQYVAFQEMRTPAFVQTIDTLIEEGVSSILSKYGKYKLSEELMDSIGFPDAEISAWSHLGAACDEVRDLKIRYLMSKRDGFLTSDQPVAVYNPWALKGGFGRNGFGCRGLMLFLPVCGRISVMLYDSHVYRIRSQDRKSAFISISRKDETVLNKLQIVGNRSVLYLPRPDRHLEVQKLARRVRSEHPPETGSLTVRLAKSDDGSPDMFDVQEKPVYLGVLKFLYESKEWREVPISARGFGVYGSRNSDPHSGLMMLRNTRSWNSTRFTDDDGGISYLRKRHSL